MNDFRIKRFAEESNDSNRNSGLEPKYYNLIGFAISASLMIIIIIMYCSVGITIKSYAIDNYNDNFSGWGKSSGFPGTLTLGDLKASKLQIFLTNGEEGALIPLKLNGLVNGLEPFSILAFIGSLFSTFIFAIFTVYSFMGKELIKSRKIKKRLITLCGFIIVVFSIIFRTAAQELPKCYNIAFNQYLGPKSKEIDKFYISLSSFTTEFIPLFCGIGTSATSLLIK